MLPQSAVPLAETDVRVLAFDAANSLVIGVHGELLAFLFVEAVGAGDLWHGASKHLGA